MNYPCHTTNLAWSNALVWEYEIYEDLCTGEGTGLTDGSGTFAEIWSAMEKHN